MLNNIGDTIPWPKHPHYVTVLKFLLQNKNSAITQMSSVFVVRGMILNIILIYRQS